MEPSSAPAYPQTSRFGKTERDIFIASLFAKVLLFPAYRSTDFEVHRNWLAITKNLPLKEWYFDATSEWTLDYPPFFAYFERLLAGVAYMLDPSITQLSTTPISTWSTVAFQRTSVIVSELVLAFALLKTIRPNDSQSRLVAASIFLHPGLLIVDSIHFQYNGMLLGLLLLSIAYAREGNHALCALYFAVLLNFKHIFVYLAPPFVVYLFRASCFDGKGTFQAHRLVQLAAIVIFVTAAAFAPFVALGGLSQLTQILSRLFPFQRGLNHAYWAGNVWAIYSAVDRIFVKYLLYRGLSVKTEAIHSASRGLVGDITFGVLPEIKAIHCFAITLAANAIYGLKLWRQPSPKRFVTAIVLSAFTSFHFGFHVHEKAILLALVPLSLLATESYAHLRIFMLATVSGVFALFPLLIQPAETPIKLIYASVWPLAVFAALSRTVYTPNPSSLSIIVGYLENLYMAGFPLLQLFVSVVHPYFCSSSIASDLLAEQGQEADLAKPAMEFLPLMMTSVYCAIGLIWSWLRLSYLYIQE